VRARWSSAGRAGASCRARTCRATCTSTRSRTRPAALAAPARLRRTAAASWLAAGLSLVYVRRQLGHASITTTEQVYGHVEDGFLRGAADRVERLSWTPADG
jgi:integrase